MTRVVALTTEDNPWNPFDDFESWDQFDRDKGYNTLSLIDRVAMLNDSIPDSLKEKYEEEAIDEIIEMNKGIIPYKKVYDTVDDYT